MRPAGGDPLSPHLGVYISYRSDEIEELTHLVDFLTEYFRLTSRSRKQSNHPYVQIGDVEISLPKLVKALPHFEDADTFVAIGFRYPTHRGQGGNDFLTFRAYTKYLTEYKGMDMDNARICYTAVSRLYFPQGKDLH